MTITQKNYDGDGSTTQFTIGFPYLQQSDIKASINGADTSFTFVSGDTDKIQFSPAPADGAKIRICRQTDDSVLPATYYTGGPIRADDLNNNFNQILYISQEVYDRFVDSYTGTTSLIFEGSTANDKEITLTSVDPTADRTITLPDQTGNVVVSGNASIVNADINANAEIAVSKLADGAARQLLQTDAGGSGVEWASNIDIPGTLAVTGNTTFDGAIAAVGNASFLGATTFYSDTTIGNGTNDTITIGGTLGVTGDTTLSNLTVTSPATFNNNVTVNGNTTLGDTAGDQVRLVGRIYDHIVPVNTSINLGQSGANRWGNAYVTTLDVGGASTLTGNTTVGGTLGVTGESTFSNHINIPDAKEIKIGASDDLKIWHGTAANDGGVAIIANYIDSGSQDLIMQVNTDSKGIVFHKRVGDGMFEFEVLAGFTAGGACQLRYDNSQKLSTTASGIEVTGQVDLDDITGAGVLTSGTSTSDTKVYSAKRTSELIDAQIVALVDEVGGYVPITNELAFPNTNPDISDGVGTIVSIGTLSTNYTSSGSGVITIANGTVGNSTVTITGAENNTQYKAGFGLLVISTSTLNTYTFHRYSPNATDVYDAAQLSTELQNVSGQITPTNNIASIAGQITPTNNIATVAGAVTNIGTNATNIANINTVATNINSVNDFHDKYRIASSAPSSNNDAGDLYYNTSDNKLYLYNGSSWTSASHLNAAGGTVTGDTTFTDNTNLQLGTGNDLKIYHDGDHSHIVNSTGNLRILADGTGDLVLTSKAGEEAIKCVQGLEVKLMHGNVPRFQTTASGAKTTGRLEVTEKVGIGNRTSTPDEILHVHASEGEVVIHNEAATDAILKLTSHAGDSKINFGDAASGNIGAIEYDHGTDSLAVKVNSSNALTISNTQDATFAGDVNINSSILQITSGTCLIDLMETSATNHRIRNGNGNFHIQRISDDKNTTTDQLVIDGGTGAVKLYFDGSAKLETFTWGVQNYGNVAFRDSDKATFGAGEDLKIYHDGSNTYFDHLGTGSVVHRIQSGDIYFQHYDGSNVEDMAVIKKNGAVELYYDNSLKIRTASHGLDILDAVVFDNGVHAGKDINWIEDSAKMRWQDGVEATFGASDDLRLYHDGTDNYFQTGATTTHFRIADGNRLTLKSDGNIAMQGSGGKNLEFKVATGLLTFTDNTKATFGTGDDLQMWADGSNSYIQHSGDGDLFVQATGDDENLWLRAKDDVSIQTNDNENAAIFTKNGAVTLYWDGDPKFETNSTGTKTTGGHIMTNGGTITGGDISFADNSKAKFGDDNDLEVFHNNARAKIQNNTGELRICSDVIELKNYDDDTNYLSFASGGNATFETGTAGTLKVKGTSNGTNVNTGDAGTYLQLQNLSTNANTFTTIQGVDGSGQGTSQIAFVNLVDGTNQGQMVFSTRPANGTMTSALTINSTQNASFAGKVGIGASADSSKLLSVNESSSGTNVVSFVNGSDAGYGTYIAGGTDANYALKIANYAGTEAFKVLGDGTATFAGQLTIPSKASTYEGITLSTPNGDGSGEFHIGVHEAGTSNGRSIVFKRGGADGCDTESVRIGNDGTTTFSGVVKPNDNGQRDLGSGSNKWHTVHTRFVKIGSSTGDGIQFSAYDEDTTDGNNISSNTLDDYEEGTWVPQFSTGFSAAAQTHGTDGALTVGSYTKVGNLVNVSFIIRLADDTAGGHPSTSNGQRINITGLPFTSASTTYHYGVGSTAFHHFVGTTDATAPAAILIGTASTTLDFYQGSNNFIGGNGSDQKAKTLYGAATYHTNT